MAYFICERVNSMEVGSTIRTLRKQRRLTLNQLSEKVGISYASLHRIEKGLHSPSVAVLSEIAIHLGHSITSLLSQIDQNITFLGQSSRHSSNQ